MCFVDYDENEKIMFSMIQLESWDFEHWLEDQSQHFNLNELAKNQKSSTSWKSFEEFIIKFFDAKTENANIKFELFEVEIEADGRIFLYLVAYEVEPFTSVTWHFSLLMGHSNEQQNKLEFNYFRGEEEFEFFAYFFENETYKTIIIQY